MRFNFLAVALLSAAMGLMVSTTTHAQEQLLSDDIVAEFEAKTQLKVLSLANAPLNELVTLTTSRGIFYLSQDGQFLVNGAIINLQEGFRNETEQAMAKFRIDQVAKIADSGILYQAKDEKFRINVFTDITCGYCQKLHRELEDYLAAGISVNYLAYPRQGLNGPVYKDMVSIWCASEPQKAMTDAKLNNDVVAKSCSTKVAEHYRTGGALGVNGTPNMILADGSLIPGYQPAKALLAELNKRLGS